MDYDDFREGPFKIQGNCRGRVQKSESHETAFMTFFVFFRVNRQSYPIPQEHNSIIIAKG